ILRRGFGFVSKKLISLPLAPFPQDLGISKMAKSLIQATRQQHKTPRASPKSRKKFEATTEVRRSSRARTTVSYKDDFPELDDFVRRRRVSKSVHSGRGYTGRISSYQQQQRAFKRAEKLQDSLDPDNPSFVKTMVRSHVSSCFWLVRCCSLDFCLTNFDTYARSTNSHGCEFSFTQGSPF
uniref:Uncharacterized protein n=1 Tax=Aegilops tauschii subsp. strangulata TaxID=200361 RepID=A0A452ZCZ4_AEGTS